MEVRRNPFVDGALERALIDLWVRVTDAGGAVGFVRPADPADVAALAADELGRVRAGSWDLAVAFEEDAPVGFGFLAPGATPLTAHLGTIKRLQRDPGKPGRGVGRAVLAALEAAAWERGLSRVVLTARGATGVERFYLSAGYRVDGVLPGRLLIAGNETEEWHMSKASPGRPDGLPLRVVRIDPEIPLPAYARAGDAGLDLRARVPVVLEPGARAAVATGIAVEVPEGCVGLVHPRSGLAAEHGIGLVNAPGTIDARYRGEIRVLLVNHGDQTVSLDRGDRIAQLVIQRVERAVPVEVSSLSETERGDGGFGSTGR